MEYPYFKVYHYEAGQLHKWGYPSSTGMVDRNLDLLKKRVASSYHSNFNQQFVIVECVGEYQSHIVEVLTLEDNIQKPAPEPTYTFQDAIDGKVNFNLKPGFNIICDKTDCAVGSRYEVSVLNPEGKEVWWSAAYSEEVGLDNIKRIVKQYKN